MTTIWRGAAPFTRSPFAAVLAVLIVLMPLWSVTRVLPLSSYDQPYYLKIADDLLQSGRFTDGFYGGAEQVAQTASGMRYPPLYPALLAGAAALEQPFRAAMSCVAAAKVSDGDTGCPRSATLARVAQFLMLVGIYTVLWWIGGVVGGSTRTAWLTLGVALVPAPLLLISVNYLMTEMASLFFSTAATAAGLAAWRSRRPARWLTAAGCLLGLASLIRPSFLYLFLAAATCGVALVCFRALVGRRGRALGLLGAFLVGFAVPVAPWIGRNALLFGRPSLSHGYDSHTLVQRIAFDAMTWREYGLSFVCWLPDGNGLGSAIDGPHACDRFGWDDHPNSFYAIGIGPLMEQTLAAAGGWDGHLRYLLTHYILREPIKHLLVTIPLALRGAWVDHYWGVLFGLICYVHTIGAIRRRDTAFLIVSLPAWFMLVFNAAVAVNQPRYNLMLVPPYAVAGALAIERVLTARARIRAQPA